MFSLYKKAYAGLSTSTWILAVVLLINRCGAMVIPFMTVYLTQQLHFSVQQAGLVMTCYGIGGIVGAFSGGRLSDRYGFYPVQFWSLLLQGLIFLVLGQMHTLLQFCICIFILSAVGDAFRPANTAATAHYSNPENRTRSYSLNRLASNLGWSIGPAVGGIVASFSYHLLFWVDGLTCIVAILFMRFFIPPVRVAPKIQEVKEQPAVKTASVYKDGVYLTFIALSILFTTGFLQLSTMVALYFKEVLHLEEAQIGMVLGINGLLVAAIEMVLIYKIENRKHPLEFMTRGVALASLAYLSFNILPAAGFVSIVFIVLFTAGEMLSIPFMTAFFISRSGEHNRGQYAALYTVSFAVSTILSPTIGSAMIAHYGFRVWWYAAAGLCLASAVGFNYLYQKVMEKKGSYAMQHH
ncbi:MDR family MFS transporter [Chitinophaga sancti]|uniref:MFS transporter n=1 Tax=Chitinophaga sancti TaxID=1004 RepID=A0A1K1MLF0_9BACT|nr:MFS transporter [Chitinophaga sancti]WQD62790.1 MFS transporter [Chitinophaga sancti]WQG91586.1 MFS transporter [Chitinophaga sancti]SFW23988.1 Predicted arabinose efflux permease, MFS family [Chitinophaga sancti]